MSERVSCCAPFCRRTTAREKLDPSHNEWLCPDHWILVPAHLKRRRAKLRRMAKRTNDPVRIARINVADNIAWAGCKKKAIETAAGI